MFGCFHVATVMRSDCCILALSSSSSTASSVNVLLGDMTIVGPRPNVIREVEKYTSAEKNILKVKPGVTDLSSIVFRNLGSMLIEYDDANLSYDKLIRPLKSRFSLFCIQYDTIYLKLIIILLTIISIFWQSLTDKIILKLLYKYQGHDELKRFMESNKKLKSMSPP